MNIKMVCSVDNETKEVQLPIRRVRTFKNARSSFR